MQVNTETGFINKSLFVLTNVINKLAEGKNTFIPYRDSKLTRLLSQSLGGNALTRIICTVSPAAMNYNQTLSTLRFGTRAKRIKSKVTSNETIDEKTQLNFYKEEIRKLKREIEKRSKGFDVDFLEHSMNSKKYIPEEDYKKIVIDNRILTQDLEKYKQKYLEERNKNVSLLRLGSSLSPDNTALNKDNEILDSQSIGSMSRQNMIVNYNDLDEQGHQYPVKSSIPIDLNKSLGNKVSEQYLEEDKVHIYNEEISKKALVSKPQEQAESPEDTNYKKKLNDYLNEHLINQVEDSVRMQNERNENKLYKNRDKMIPLSQVKQKSSSSLKEINIIEAIDTDKVFDDVMIYFSIDYDETIEVNIKELKTEYDHLLTSLESAMDLRRRQLEEFYRVMIKNAKASQLENISKRPELPIIQITNEHNAKLTHLRELFEVRLRETEKVLLINQH